MNKKPPKAELEEALNSLEISEESKKVFSTSLKSRNEPLFFGYAIQVWGVLSIVRYFTSIYLYEELEVKEDSVFMILIHLFIGAFFLVYGTSRIRSIKLQRASVELIMKNKNSEPVN